MKEQQNFVEAIDGIRDEKDALDQSVALNRIVMQLLETRAQECKRLWVALIVSILVNLAIVAGFLWYESQWEYSTTTTSTEIQQEAEDDGLNLLQVGDNSRMFFGLEEDDVDGQAVSEDNNDNQDSQP